MVLNVGVIGYGMSATVFHIPLILALPESLRLHTIVQRSVSSAADASKDHSTVHVVRDVATLLADAAVDIVVVTTPPDTHVDFALRALRAGKHVVVEKPFCPTAADAQRLSAAATENARLLTVYQNRRWDADFLTVAALIKSGTLGRVVEFETRFDKLKPVRPDTWKGGLDMAQGGGVVFDLGTHLIDQAVQLFGVPEAVSCLFSHQRNDDAPEPDSFTMNLIYGSGGPLVTAKSGVFGIDDAPARFLVRGTKAAFRKSFLDCQEPQLKSGMSPLDPAFGIEPIDRSGTLIKLSNDGTPVSEIYPNMQQRGNYLSFYSQFVEAIQKNDQQLVPVKASEARDVLVVIETAIESARLGKVLPVSI
ncbi:hypothetical protein HDU83_000203 [Entophlyctis luteolus]|nr:hypothetical protein HDU83_000203 [Entophlyctis luteolus]KAJ3389783.1 hypothetical protein HDU84_008274 [Entophlyctis sp. JEL0112]